MVKVGLDLFPHGGSVIPATAIHVQLETGAVVIAEQTVGQSRSRVFPKVTGQVAHLDLSTVQRRGFGALGARRNSQHLLGPELREANIGREIAAPQYILPGCLGGRREITFLVRVSQLGSELVDEREIRAALGNVEQGGT